MAKERILISGGSGYIGSKLIQFLSKKGFECKKIPRNNFSNLDCDYMIHCAADYTSKADNILYQANFLYGDKIFSNLLNTSCKKIINLSSFSEFGDHENREPINKYAQYKAMLRKKWEHASNFDFISLVIYDVYGEDDKRNKLVNSLLRLKQGDAFELSHGRQYVDFVYIEDVCNSVLRSIKELGSGLYGVRTEQKTLREQISFIEELQQIKLNFKEEIHPEILRPRFDFKNINELKTNFKKQYTDLWELHERNNT